MADLLCALGTAQVRRLEQLVEVRERLAQAYAERLDGIAGLPRADAGDRHGWQAYVVRVARRDEALEALEASEIQAQIGTYALHRLAAYADQGPFRGADAAYERALALPFHNRITEDDVDRVAAVLRASVGG
ncbi:MAG: DegT/DnrJ/EryC1/StrS family aminotransferase [Actinomycetota bacterium]|nr:DegT/DnrJ/EryC1/StrS family aminotransferase [Actinomycetota bacterium]